MRDNALSPLYFCNNPSMMTEQTIVLLNREHTHARATTTTTKHAHPPDSRRPQVQRSLLRGTRPPPRPRPPAQAAPQPEKSESLSSSLRCRFPFEGFASCCVSCILFFR